MLCPILKPKLFHSAYHFSDVSRLPILTYFGQYLLQPRCLASKLIDRRAGRQMCLWNDIHESTTVFVNIIILYIKTWWWAHYICYNILFYLWNVLNFSYFFEIWGSVNLGHISKVTQNSNPRLSDAKVLAVIILPHSTQLLMPCVDTTFHHWLF